ncbi:MAG: NAD(P)/FAD-dependent oxidoreductase [Prosthecobacter sp.]|nr:NAD(P)/FAD-dependent oxidoreductase [Prosthecobacter sp.]
MIASDSSAKAYDVILVGAGPVGLLLGNLLGQYGMRVLLLERSLAPPSHSQAIGITPPSLQILALLDLDKPFLQLGIPIRDCHVHGHTGYLGCASFRHLGGAYPLILSLPQQITMRLLEENLLRYPTVEIRRGMEVRGLRHEASQVIVETQDTNFAASYAVGCDGCHSHVRDLLRVPSRTHHYGRHFLMGDFLDKNQLGREAQLFFMPEGAVESFPLPDARRRWIVQTPSRMTDPPPGIISRLVRERCGFDLPAADQFNQSAFSPWRLDCRRIHHDRVILCGDAAHVMSPIGGQGMNTGFADAEFAAAMLHAILQKGDAPAPWLRHYDRCRRTAGRIAANRAARGMWIGTWLGAPASLLRDFILRFCIFRGPLAPHLGPWFAMLSLPYNRLQKSQWATTRLRELSQT